MEKVILLLVVVFLLFKFSEATIDIFCEVEIYFVKLELKKHLKDLEGRAASSELKKRIKNDLNKAFEERVQIVRNSWKRVK